jgi:tRNA threonylcarbamoyladenosine biosynthesis protein TsaB
VRIGLATARALGFAWEAEVLGFPTLALIAAQARAVRPGCPVTVSTNGGHGEWFVADFDADGLPSGEAASLTPEAARARPHAALVAGGRAALLAEGSDAEALDLLPDARAALLLPPALLTPALAPIYGRGPDATPMAARVPA